MLCFNIQFEEWCTLKCTFHSWNAFLNAQLVIVCVRTAFALILELFSLSTDTWLYLKKCLNTFRVYFWNYKDYVFVYIRLRWHKRLIYFVFFFWTDQNFSRLNNIPSSNHSYIFVINYIDNCTQYNRLQSLKAWYCYNIFRLQNL